jgi:hypothetical protein
MLKTDMKESYICMQESSAAHITENSGALRNVLDEDRRAISKVTSVYSGN